MRIGRAGETLKAQVDASKHRAPGSKGEGCAVPSTSGVKPKHAKQLQAEHSGSENKRPCGGRKDQGLKLPEKLNKNQAAGSRNEGSAVPSTSGAPPKHPERITASSVLTVTSRNVDTLPTDTIGINSKKIVAPSKVPECVSPHAVIPPVVECGLIDQYSAGPSTFPSACGTNPYVLEPSVADSSLDEDNLASSDECDFEGFEEVSPATNIEKQIRQLQEIIQEKDSKIELLQTENVRLRSLNMLLQETIVRRGEDKSFTECDGYPTAEWLLSVSQNSEDSDYLFVKEMLLRLFPEGVGNATATGRTSNNPKGRNKEAVNQDPGSQLTTKLDPNKLKYMKDRLFERRRILQDPVGIAMEKARKINKHIAHAIANNPQLRKQPTQQ